MKTMMSKNRHANLHKQVAPISLGAIALSYPPRVRVRATAKLSAAFFHDESSITIGGVRKCNSAYLCQ